MDYRTLAPVAGNLCFPNLKTNPHTLKRHKHFCQIDQLNPTPTQVNMGPVEPPQRKGRQPLYGKDKLVKPQHKFDELESISVFKRPEDICITVE